MLLSTNPKDKGRAARNFFCRNTVFLTEDGFAVYMYSYLETTGTLIIIREVT